MGGAAVFLGAGLAGEARGALGDGQGLGGLDVAVVVAGHRRADADRGRVGHRGGGDLGGVLGPGAVGLLVLDLHAVAVAVGGRGGAGGDRLAVVDLGGRGAGERHVVGDVGGGDGQPAGGQGHVVVGGDVLASGLDGQLAGEGAVVAAGLGALGAVGEALPGLAADQALGVDAGELVGGAAVFLGAGLAGEGHGALGD